jgi:hypothetical protein
MQKHSLSMLSLSLSLSTDMYFLQKLSSTIIILKSIVRNILALNFELLQEIHICREREREREH